MRTPVGRAAPAAVSIEARFHAEMLALYDRCAALGFRPVMLRRLVVLGGGVATARDLVFKPGTTGLERLMQAGLAASSMEAAMIRPEFQTLFSPAERREAERRLTEMTPRSRSRGRLTAQAGATKTD